MSDAPFDQNLANQAQAVDQCMKLGAVIIKPSSQPTIGFVIPPSTCVDAKLIGNTIRGNTIRRNTR